MSSDINKIKWVYFGGEPLGVPVLDILKAHGLKPDLVVCNPDRRSGRKMRLTPPPVKSWAEANDIAVFQPENLKDPENLKVLTEQSWDLFVVVAYNHILPKWLIDLPKYKTINLHPSMLPLMRGPSPIRSAVLEDNRTAVGVSVMLMDEKMDHGPILAQEHVNIDDQDWPTSGSDLDNLLARRGGRLLVDTIKKWLNQEISPKPQNHELATYTEKITKDMGLLDLDPFNLPTGEEAKQALIKIRALDDWPGTYFFYNNKRVRVKTALIDETNTLKILLVTPEGKKEMSFDDYLKGQQPA